MADLSKVNYYCYYCGSKCDLTDHGGLFDEFTGRQKTHLKAKCPNVKWYGSYHTDKLLDGRELMELGLIEKPKATPTAQNPDGIPSARRKPDIIREADG